MIGVESKLDRASSIMGQNLKILAVHRYFWPDTPPYALILRSIVQRWQQDGHDVSVLSAQPSYKQSVGIHPQPQRECLDGVEVKRLNLPNETGRPFTRVLNALRLGFSLIWRAVLHRYDVIMISTSPPVVGGFFAAVGAKLSGGRFIYHCMDIHPEVGRISGEFNNPLIYKWLLKIDTWVCRQAEPVIVLSEDMKQTLLTRPHIGSACIQVINNFGLPSEDEETTELPFMWSKNKLTILFAGNIGRFQGLDAVVEAMSNISDRDNIEFVFMGEGIARKALEQKAIKLGAQVKFIGHHSVEIAKAAMRLADAGFISLSADVIQYAFPSKTMTYLEQGCPLIVAVEPESELAKGVVKDGYGFCVPPEDPQALVALLRRLAKKPNLLSDKRLVAKRKYKEQFSEQIVLKQWSSLVNAPLVS